MTTFHLPDLGEGLQEAEIVSWHVKEGDDVRVDQLMVSVETAKAVVEVPSPYSGKIARLLAKAGDVVATHQAIVEFELNDKQAAASSATPAKAPTSSAGATPSSMTVVGRMNVSDHELVERAVAGGSHRHIQRTRLRAAPAARILAKRLSVDLDRVSGSGRDGIITIDDVLHAGKLTRQSANAYQLPALGERLAGEFEPLHGPRRVMAQSMTLSRDEIAMVTVFDDADVHNWPGRVDMTARIIRALCRGIAAEPSLNAIFDPDGPARRVLKHVDVGIAIDVGDKLLVPVIRDAEKKSLLELRDELNRFKQASKDRTLSMDDMRDPTITITNFGTLAGRYATPLIVPPMVAILGTGKVHRDVVATESGGIEVHPRIPLSLTFDHRCITGGEACRFLATVIKDLELPE
ncbi:MAG TPA: dihydrolipoamide acetyltransferase family protein [Steroidobacteraceae bacterium]|nr:dihydrolipoamide acetyltransferase family protein [Steroidobacteraceae bacterium]